MTNAGPWRYHAEVVEGALSPAQKGVALKVTLKFFFDVFAKGLGTAKGIHHDRVIDDQIHRREGVDLVGIAPQVDHGVAHGRQVDYGGHPGEILHQNASGPIGNFALGGLALEPVGHGLHVGGGHRSPVFMAQQVLEQHLEAEGQAADVSQGGGSGGQAVNNVGGVTDGEVGLGVKTVHRGWALRSRRA